MPIFRFALLAALALVPLRSLFADADYPPPVKSIIENRCMVCHGCYDAPCQLKLDAWAGLDRGASKEKVYDGTRLLTANLTRLFEDAQTTQEWRDNGFYPVLDDARPQQGTLYRMLQLKQQHPLPSGQVLPDSFDFNLDRKQQCPKPNELDRFARNYPLWGMPYGLPGLNEEEHGTLTNWLEQGAPGIAIAKTSPRILAQVERWEAFFNGESLKQQLMSRYIFEHLFIGNLYFSDIGGSPVYYNLIRSRTPPGEAIDIIATRRPFDAPGVDSFYYRLQPLRTAVLDKRHMPYALNDKRMQRWQSLFLNSSFSVSRLPDYGLDVSANPFMAFKELPLVSRYKFMLDEAQFTIMGFIKGPVCRGQVALNVIDDHFWVAFVDPERLDGDENAEFLAREHNNMRLPTGSGGLLVTLVEWRGYSKSQLKYIKAKSKFISEQAGATASHGVTLDTIWDGDGSNTNAALTIFRHRDSASVVRGFVGEQPKTAWVIDYSLLERIHYLLVAGFDVYGNVSHQLESRLYMDFLRMEGEQNFLLLLPQETRRELANFWYRDASADVKKYVLGGSIDFETVTSIAYKTDNPKQELLELLAQRLPGAAEHRYALREKELLRLQKLTGPPFSLMPQVAFVDLLGSDGTSTVYTMIHNNAYSNNAQIFNEARRRIPAEDKLTITRGLIGSYPNAFFQVNQKDLGKFVADIEGLRKQEDYARLLTRYGVRRNDPWFWRVSDKFHAQYKSSQPVEWGIFDLNRYENR